MKRWLRELLLTLVITAFLAAILATVVWYYTRPIFNRSIVGDHGL